MTRSRRIADPCLVALLTAFASLGPAATSALAQHGGGHGGGGQSGGGVAAGTLLAIGAIGAVVVVGILVWIVMDARGNAPGSGRPKRPSGGTRQPGRRQAKGGPARARARAARAARRHNR